MDASAVVDALVLDEGTERLRAMLASEVLHAPTLLDYEVSSAVRGLNLGRHLDDERCVQALADFDDLPVTRWPNAKELRRRAFELRHGLSTYDGAYVALAEALECSLVTRDVRLARSKGHAATIVVA